MPLTVLKLDPASARGAFDYRDGALYHKAPRVRSQVGTRAGWIHAPSGRRYVTFGGRPTLEHRVIWAVVYGEWPASEIDHIDGDRTNNRVSNLRLADREMNMQNLRSAKRSNQLGVLGVHATRYGFVAQITAGGYRYLGTFATAAAAHHAYLEAKRRLHEGCTI